MKRRVTYTLSFEFDDKEKIDAKQLGEDLDYVIEDAVTRCTLYALRMTSRAQVKTLPLKFSNEVRAEEFPT